MAADRIRSDKELRPVTVLLDANALLMPFQFKLNLDSELERVVGSVRVVVPSVVKVEVEGLAKGGNRHAKTALKLLEKYELVECPGKGDDAIVDCAKGIPDCVVVTNDKGLDKRLSALGIKRIRLFKKTKLGWA